MAIELKGVTKVVGIDTHIHATSIKLEEGRFNTLLGTTLSGKTTLLRLMAGLERPSKGEIWFKGRRVTGVPVQKRNVAMVYQQFINYPNFNVYDNIASPLKVVRMPAQEIALRVRKVAELLQIEPLLKRMPGELSGGQQQRTALARALVKESDLVLLDEPLANLDYKLREELREELPKRFMGGEISLDFPYDGVYEGVYRERQYGSAQALYDSVGIAREDKAARHTQFMRNFTCFDAPHVAFLFLPEPFGLREAADLGMYAQTLMLAMTAHGLGSCPQTALSFEADCIRATLGIDASNKLLFGISFGYPDPDAPVNNCATDRAAVVDAVCFHS